MVAEKAANFSEILVPLDPDGAKKWLARSQNLFAERAPPLAPIRAQWESLAAKLGLREE